MLKTSALKIAHYDFEDKKGKAVNTSKLIVSLGDFGTLTVNTPLANEYEVFTKLAIELENVDNKFVVKSINK